jgi:hypothetical protein
MENDIKKDKAVSEIDRVVAWVNILSKEKKKVILPIVIFGLLGVLVALISPRNMFRRPP